MAKDDNMFEQIDDAVECAMLNPQKFSMNIIEKSLHNDINIIDAVVSYCEDHGYEMEDVIPLLDDNIKERIRVCGIEERYVPGAKVSRNKLF